LDGLAKVDGGEGRVAVLPVQICKLPTIASRLLGWQKAKMQSQLA
jgi:hypothetical protein